jgi:hypothetical protein
MGYRYGISKWDIGHQWYIDRDVDMRYGLSIWDMVCRYGHSPYRYGIWANDVGDDSIDMSSGYRYGISCHSAPYRARRARLAFVARAVAADSTRHVAVGLPLGVVAQIVKSNTRSLESGSSYTRYRRCQSEMRTIQPLPHLRQLCVRCARPAYSASGVETKRGRVLLPRVNLPGAYTRPLFSST